MAKLYVAVHRAVNGNYEHWALYLEDDGHKTMIQVLNEHPNFVYSEEAVDPKSSGLHKTNIFVADINQDNVQELKDSVRKIKVDNDTLDWNCQDFVIEALDALEGECIIDEEDEDYQKARRHLKRIFGPQI